MNLAGFNELCVPAILFLAVNFVGLLVIAIQNYGSVTTYCVGNFACNISDIWIVFSMKVLYVLFWTWIINMFCHNDLEPVAWLLFLIPFLILFVSIAALMLF
jgi:hypothetical protein